jgi:hypothetical protein
MAGRDHLPAAVVRRVREAAAHRCGYCRADQEVVLARFEIDHIIPLAAGGTDDECNLWLACPLCNGHKSGKTTGTDPETGGEHPLFNPRTERWADHFRWSADGVRVVGLTAVGRATVSALQLDSDPLALKARQRWIAVGWHPPPDAG